MDGPAVVRCDPGDDYRNASCTAKAVAVIVALWHRWREDHRARWILAACLLLVIDAYLGAKLVAWEIEYARGAW